MNFLNFLFDEIEKQSIINLNYHGSKSYASVVLGDSEVIFLTEGEGIAFVNLSVVFLLSTALQYRAASHRISLSSILLGIFRRSRGIFCF